MVKRDDQQARKLILPGYLHPAMMIEICLYLVMAEIQVIQQHEDADQPQVIIIMVHWNLALVTLFLKGFLLER